MLRAFSYVPYPTYAHGILSVIFLTHVHGAKIYSQMHRVHCYTPNAFRPQMHSGASKRVWGSWITKCISGRSKMHLGTIINTKCISGQLRQLLKCKPLPNAFRCVQMHLVTSQMIFIQPQLVWMHLDVTKCILLCNEMRTDENCINQPQYIIIFHTAVVSAINWLKFANHNNTCLYHHCVTYLFRLQPVHQIL